MRIERSARKTGALGERRDINARKVAAFGKARWQAPGEGHAASEGTGDSISRAGTSVLLVTQPVRYYTVRVLLHTVCINT